MLCFQQTQMKLILQYRWMAVFACQSDPFMLQIVSHKQNWKNVIECKIKKKMHKQACIKISNPEFRLSLNECHV